MSTAINSIQRGTISLSGAQTSNTASISAVVVAKSSLHFLGADGFGNVEASEFSIRIALTNTVTVTATRSSVSGGTTCTVGFEVVEYL